MTAVSDVEIKMMNTLERIYQKNAEQESEIARLRALVRDAAKALTVLSTRDYTEGVFKTIADMALGAIPEGDR